MVSSRNQERSTRRSLMRTVARAASSRGRSGRVRAHRGTNPKLVPDLATSIPTSTDGDRTYTFELRSGIRYSNGEVVAPGDFLRALERGFGLEASVADFFGGLVGAEACVNEPDAVISPRVS